MTEEAGEDDMAMGDGRGHNNIDDDDRCPSASSLVSNYSWGGMWVGNDDEQGRREGGDKR